MTAIFIFNSTHANAAILASLVLGIVKNHLTLVDVKSESGAGWFIVALYTKKQMVYTPTKYNPWHVLPVLLRTNAF